MDFDLGAAPELCMSYTTERAHVSVDLLEVYMGEGRMQLTARGLSADAYKVANQCLKSKVGFSANTHAKFACIAHAGPAHSNPELQLHTGAWIRHHVVVYQLRRVTV